MLPPFSPPAGQRRFRWLLAVGTLLAAAIGATAASDARAAVLALPGVLLPGSQPAASGAATSELNLENGLARLATVQARHGELLAQPEDSEPLLAERQLAAARLLGLLSARVAALRDQAGSASADARPAAPAPALQGSPPYSITDVDALRDQLDALGAQQAALRLTLKSLDSEVEAAVDARAAVDAALRRQQDRAGRVLGDREPALKSAELELAALQAQIAELELVQADVARQQVRELLAALNEPMAQLQREIDRVRGTQRLDEADMAKMLQQFAADARRRGTERNRLAEQLARREGDITDAGPTRVRELQALHQTRAILRELESVEQARAALWRSRQEALNAGSDSARKQAAAAALVRGIEQVQAWRRSVSEQEGLVLSELRTRQALVRSLPADDTGRAGEQRVVDALQAQLDSQEQLRESLDRGQVLLSRSLNDLGLASRPDSLNEWAERIQSTTGDWLGAIWNFELFSATEATQIDGRVVNVEYGVTVGKSLGVLLLLGLGYWAAGFLSRVAVGLMVRRLHISDHLGGVLRRWIRSILMLVVLMLVLKMARIPITAFAFLGGALAIGVGFGAQNVIKNLISGIIILTERKIRVGDIVTVGGMSGTVTTVDLRATTVRGFDGIDAIVPNSTLLENQISNWSGGSPDVRRSVVVGVSYGSDLRQAATLITDCAAAHDAVLKLPAPEVFFEDFGSDSLTLRLQYWTRLGGPRAGPSVDSDLRFAISDALQAAGIGIAFPQRDVHLDVPGAIRVELTGGSAGSVPPAAPPLASG